MKKERGKLMYKVERIPAINEGIPYEVMLSPFNTLSEVKNYIQKYSQYYPKEERNYKITELNHSEMS